MQFLLDEFRGVGPSLVAATPAQRAVAALATRIHDVYMSPIQVGILTARASTSSAGHVTGRSPLHGGVLC